MRELEADPVRKTIRWRCRLSKLTVISAKNAKPGRHADGKGLYLLVKPSGARSWLLRVQVMGHRRDIGLGSTTDLGLAEAREKASQLRRIARQGGDPIAERDKDKFQVPTFTKAVEAAHKELSKGWTDKHAAAFLSGLKAHACPSLGKLKVDTIEPSHVRDALAGIWIEKPSIARKVRQWVATVLDFANVKGWRSTGAPAAKVVSKGLAKQTREGNFAAMPYTQVPTFVSGLRALPLSKGRQALIFTILTAARSGEVRNAKWSHFDLENGLWNRPAELMKSRKAHTVTLSPEAISLIEEMKPYRASSNDCLVFGGKGGKLLSDMTLTKALRDAGRSETVHGFRSAFRDWVSEETDMQSEVAEMALAHAIPSKVEAAYRRGELIAKRRRMMNAWTDFCMAKGKVIHLRQVPA